MVPPNTSHYCIPIFYCLPTNLCRKHSFLTYTLKPNFLQAAVWLYRERYNIRSVSYAHTYTYKTIMCGHKIIYHIVGIYYEYFTNFAIGNALANIKASTRFCSIYLLCILLWI